MTTASPPPRPEAASTSGDGLGHRTVSAARWRLASGMLQATLQLGVGIALARLLPPADFGLATMATVVLGLAGLGLDLSIGTAVIQRRPLTERHIRVSFTLGSTLGVLLAGALLLTAEPAGRLLRAEGLPTILRAEAVLFVFSGIGVTARALLQRGLAFRQLAVADLAGYGLGYALVGITLAAAGYGVWSLVAGAVVQSLLSNTLVLRAVRHSFRPLLARQEAGDLFRLSSLNALNGVASQVAFQGDNFVVGRVLGTAALGLYGRAFTLMMAPLGHAGNALASVLLPALAELHADRGRFARAYLLAISLITLAAAPVMIGMAVAAPELIHVLYGDAWAAAVVPLQIFCLVGVFRLIAMPAGAVTKAVAQVDAELRRQIVYAAGVLLGSAIGARWGITGVAIGVAIAILYKYVAMVALTLRIGGITWRDFLEAQAPGLVVALGVGLCAVMARWACVANGAGNLATLAVTAAVCAVALIGGVHLLPHRIRPTDLFQRLSRAALPLPAFLRLPIDWTLRPHG